MKLQLFKLLQIFQYEDCYKPKSRQAHQSHRQGNEFQNGLQRFSTCLKSGKNKLSKTNFLKLELCSMKMRSKRSLQRLFNEAIDFKKMRFFVIL
jgi:hypothetical protein